MYEGERPEIELNSLFGENNWSVAPTPPCKTITGINKITVKSSVNRSKHKRKIKITIPKEDCDCEYKNNCFPAKCPELNITENVFHWIRNELKERSKAKGAPKNQNHLKKRLKKVIKIVGKKKSWFNNAFNGLQKRYKAMIDSNAEQINY
ncbi:MAG TPA: hypothetical protein VGA80_01990 [Flavobacteriaceae bacterium]